MYETKGTEYVVEYYYWHDNPRQLRFGYIIVSAKNMAEAAKKRLMTNTKMWILGRLYGRNIEV